LKSSLPISGIGGAAPTPYRPEYVRGISFELRRERRGGDDVVEDEEAVRTPPIVSSSLVSIVVYSLEENRLLGVDGADDAIVSLRKALTGGEIVSLVRHSPKARTDCLSE
jgi:hypothetical protein